MRAKIAAGNWKMNTDNDSGSKLASEVVNMVNDELRNDAKVILIPPFTHLLSVGKLIKDGKNIFLGAQNCHEQDGGAYTGEISVDMLKSVGVQYIVLGHSERREFFGEDAQLLAKKTDKVLEKGLTPIFCCGEKLETREEEKHFDLVGSQIKDALFHLEADNLTKVVIAYEPVWAIGTGVTASAEQAQEMHAFIRKTLAEKYGQKVAEEISILYGGSVKPDNASELFACKDVDGGLVGGASLKSRDFVDIAKAF